ncbi:transglycosylase family protein [Frankia sp. Cr2]|uniref:transglycosylase family protein n=1 Tax=Frankia sp. Cr2 TaxID=3073932 RepID=UPI002AD57007|nr:transglycosylase family protein [Frankia sp. Cr2]
MVVTPALVAAIGGGIAMSQPASAATTWEGLRQCESGGDYGANTGNGYYGAYQFSLGTWQGLGYTGLPSSASPGTQDEAAIKLAARSGFSQWPVCGKGMGADQLGAGASPAGAAPAHTGTSGASAPDTSAPDSSSSDTGSSQARSYGRNGASRWESRTVSADTSSTSADATPLTPGLVDQVRSDVLSWQNQMNSLGYKIQIDGRYGPESAGAASRLQADKGLAVDGICGPETWGATFS